VEAAESDATPGTEKGKLGRPVADSNGAVVVARDPTRSQRNFGREGYDAIVLTHVLRITIPLPNVGRALSYTDTVPSTIVIYLKPPWKEDEQVSHVRRTNDVCG